MSKSLDLTTALGVSRTLLQKVSFDSSNVEGQFGEAYQVYHDLWSVITSGSALSDGSRHDVAIAIAGYASEVISGAMSIDVAKLVIGQTIAEAEEASTESPGEGHESSMDQLVHESEAEILKAALKIRRAVEQMPLGQDSDIAVSYILTLVSDRAKNYSRERSQNMSVSDGFEIFIRTMPLVTDIALDAWSRLGSTYYNPTNIVFERSYVRGALSEFRTYLEAYDMGLGAAVGDLVTRTADFIAEVAENEVSRFEHLSKTDINGVKLGIADQLIAIAQRAWRLCINNLISEVDEMLAEPEKAKQWLEQTDKPIEPDALLAAIRSLYAELPAFTNDADIDLESLDELVNQEFALTVQAADAMVSEMVPWSM
ncbi:hypothetical protein [Marinobacter sp.]|uniref:hypothetical protein n=1 Tax=Marinobacter sp. TaxID=50741 RepID=UPI003567AD2A